MIPRSVELLKTLIGFPSVSADSNLDLIRWIEAYLAQIGIETRNTFDASGRKANLFATLGQGEGGLVLSGHTDVVPVVGQAWSHDPFQALVRDGRVYGRGACDMKGFIAVALALAPKLRDRPLREPVHLAFSYDEEIGCLGVRKLLADLDAIGVRPRGCVIGEPTGMRVVTGHKGAGMYAFKVVGRPVHSSLAPQGVNAIGYAARIIARLQDIEGRLRREERRGEDFDAVNTTIQVNRITGGGAGNIVAETCEFLVDVRSLPWTDQAELIGEAKRYIALELLPAMREIAPEADVTVEQIGDVPSFWIDDGHDLVREVRHACRNNHACGKVAFGTEAGLFQQAGIPTLICGPGSIEQAHRPDEFVEIDQLVQCEAMLERLLSNP